MSFFDFEKIPALVSDRLTLREMRVSDSLDMYEYSKEKKVTEFLLWKEHTGLEYTKRHLKYISKMYNKGMYYDWAIILNTSNGDAELDKYRGRMIGTCGFAALDLQNGGGELGYVLNPAVWGHGIAVEASKEVIRFGFEQLGLKRIEARYMVGNDSSRRVMEKLGMSYEGTYRSKLFVKGEFKDIVIYSILRDEYMK